MRNCHRHLYGPICKFSSCRIASSSIHSLSHHRYSHSLVNSFERLSVFADDFKSDWNTIQTETNAAHGFCHRTKLRFDKCRCHFDMELIHSEIAGIAKCDIAAGTKWRSSKKRNVKLILTVFIVALLLSGYVPHGKKPTMIDRCRKIGANIEFFVLRCGVMPSLATIKMSAAHKSN